MKRSIIALALFSISTVSFASKSIGLNEAQKTDLYCAGWNQAHMEAFPEDTGEYNEALNAVNFFYMKGENDGLNDDDSTKSALMDTAWNKGYQAYNGNRASTMPEKCFKLYAKHVQSLTDEELQQ